jgi:hypothetical protein
MTLKRVVPVTTAVLLLAACGTSNPLDPQIPSARMDGWSTMGSGNRSTASLPAGTAEDSSTTAPASTTYSAPTYTDPAPVSLEPLDDSLLARRGPNLMGSGN